ncbi:MAG: alpha/beta hydrolase family protein [Thermoplasmata archaeon]
MNKFSVLEHLRREVKKIKPKYSFDCRSFKEFIAWRSNLKNKLIELLRIKDNLSENRMLKSKIVLREEYNDYFLEKIEISSFDNFVFPAYLLIPKNLNKDGKAILCFHGHGRGKKDVCGIVSNEKERQMYISPLNYDYGYKFAKRGYIVLAPDGRCFGETTPLGENCTWMFCSFLLIGKTMVGLRILDGIKCIDYLIARKEVNPEKIGCMGLSWGGTATLYLSAIDERIKAACISGYFDSFKDMLMERGCCPCQYIPDIYLYADLPDITGLIAPRPLLIEYGKNDPLYTYSEVIKAYNHLKKIYKIAKAEKNLYIDIFEGAHQFSGKLTFDFFESNL